MGFVRAADVHEQKKPWVPLMLEDSYRPSGWLGIMCVAAACHTHRALALDVGPRSTRDRRWK